MGRVLAVGDGVEDIEPGQRVAWVYAPGSYAERIAIPATSLVKVPDAIVLAIGVIAGFFFDRLAGPSWLARQFSGSTRGIITSALVGVAGAFVGYHIGELLAPGGGILTTVIAAVVWAAVMLFFWRMAK